MNDQDKAQAVLDFAKRCRYCEGVGKIRTQTVFKGSVAVGHTWETCSCQLPNLPHAAAAMAETDDDWRYGNLGIDSNRDPKHNPSY